MKFKFKKMKEVNFADLPEPGDRYKLGDLLGIGTFGKVYQATDLQASNKNVAIKMQKYEEFVEEEYRILRDCSSHVNIIEFYGVYKLGEEIWFVIEVRPFVHYDEIRRAKPSTYLFRASDKF